MGFSRGRSSIECDNIKTRLSEAQLLATYLGITHIPCLIKSPFREDKNPSFSIFTKDGEHIHYVDFATKEKGNTFDLLKKLWDYSFDEVIRRAKDNTNVSYIEVDRPNSPICVTTSEKTNIQCKVRDWEPHDIEYWESYGISIDWLKFADVHPISHKIITKGNLKYTFGADKYAYCYVERKDGNITIKIYQPFNKKYKWAGNIDRGVWSLWTKIPKFGKNLFLSSSLKDCLNLWANTGIPAICMQGEGYLPKPQIIEELKSRYENIIVFYDNDYSNPDNPGKKDSEELCKLYDLKKVEIPSKYQSKDPSDLYKKYGREEYRRIMMEILSPVILK